MTCTTNNSEYVQRKNYTMKESTPTANTCTHSVRYNVNIYNLRTYQHKKQTTQTNKQTNKNKNQTMGKLGSEANTKELKWSFLIT